MNFAALQAFIDRKWDTELAPQLVEYVRVPAKSPAFDPEWRAHGHLQRVVEDAHRWCRAQPVAGLKLEIVTIEGRTPCLVFEVPASSAAAAGARPVLFYGHLDKQPEMTGWRDGFGPWTPVIEDGRLYGRGAADDGYAVYAALTSIAALDEQRVARPRCVGIIETCEESGSFDLPAYLDLLAPRLGDVALVVGLDSGCGNYDQLWVTTSLRGLIGGVLSVEVLGEGVHSGYASGLVPSSFRIARQLLDRIDDAVTGRVRDPAFHADVPPERLEQARRAGALLGDQVWRTLPWVESGGGKSVPTTTDPVEGLIARTWRPALSVTGAAGLPSIEMAGNVLRPLTALKLSLRLPPSIDAEWASVALKTLLERDPPYNARVRFTPEAAATGWNAPPTEPWLQGALERASAAAFGREAAWIGEGGTIPFMSMLGRKFPRAQYVITGVLGPKSNAHGPNEFLHLGYAKRLTAAIASVVAEVGR